MQASTTATGMFFCPMAACFPVVWLAVVFLRVLADLRGMLCTNFRLAASKLTDPFCQDDCHKKTNRLHAVEALSHRFPGSMEPTDTHNFSLMRSNHSSVKTEFLTKCNGVILPMETVCSQRTNGSIRNNQIHPEAVCNKENSIHWFKYLP